MEQVDRGYLILNKGDKEKPKSKHSSNKEGRLLSNKGGEDEDHDGLGDDEERLDWVFKVLERYQITLEKVGLPEFIKKHGNVHLQVLMVCCGLQIVNWSWVLVWCNPKVKIKFGQTQQHKFINKTDQRIKPSNVFEQSPEYNTPIAKDQSLIQLYKKQADVFKQAVECPTVHVGGDWDLGWTMEWDRHEAALFGLEKIGIRRNNIA
ncbi:hypothetical protein PPACK8108_LOCUS25164 [Phakopsora pachyrhizi]|uniref:Uncharacterized protein n=1 Tax=Phakopsora pachyrhizi TaxID=170000 RepID=A0AAV0BT61_PHAPC|nr:hypothetical protein PPACK8108_LOCUS25164 [Phakopsora pachyrhizi]